ncbi:MAG: cytotoxic translational repressor of toxin-antitoxin stability system [Promicromonosporaceae bacterium]|nr:cytotoxic translational repressor of toxin-antitoxin stability system [Promicromonosporaceae bacterium]
MSERKPLRRIDHTTFCDVEGWFMVKDARGRPIGHHVTRKFPHPDGRMLRTRISRPIDKTPYDASLAQHILRTQLEVTSTEFWLCVDDQQPPTRGTPAPPSGTAIPASVLRVLVTKLRLTPAEITALSRDQALHLATDYWSVSPSAD